MATQTLLTLEEFDRLRDDGLRHELNRGELLTMTLPTPYHNEVVKRLFKILDRFLEANPIGNLYFPDTPFLLSVAEEPPTLRGPDLAFVTQERVARIDPRQRIQGAPDLAIEVASPSDTLSGLLEKTAQYLAAGATAVWLVYPDEREVRVFESSGEIRVLRAADPLTLPALLPSFSTPVAAFFE